MVTILVLVSIAAVVAFILYRHRQRKSSFTPEPVPGRDEEEGLLGVTPLKASPSKNGQGDQEEDMPTAKLRQGPKSKSKRHSRGSNGDLTDEENEGKASPHRPK